MIEYLDFFGQPFRLNYKGKYLFKSSFSTGISIFLIIGISLFCFWNLYEMFQHQGIIINSYQTLLSDNEYYILSNNNFSLAFQIYTLDRQNIFDQNSNLSKYFTIMFFSVGPNPQILNITECNKNVYGNINYTDFKCLDFSNITLGGNYFSIENSFSYFKISLSIDYDMFIQDYNSSQNIENTFFPLTFIIYYPIASLNLNDYYKPYNQAIGRNVFQLNYNKTRLLELSTQLVEINTDSSYFSNSTITQNVFTSNYRIRSEEFYNIYVNNIVLNLNFYLDPIKDLYYREYTKFQNVLNNISSLANVLFAFFGLIFQFYNQYKLKVDFIEENIIYKLEIEKEIKPMEIILSTEQIIPQIINFNQVQIIENNSNEKEMNNNLTGSKKFKIKLDRRPSKKIQMKDFFDFVFCCNKKETIRNFIYSDPANVFYEFLVDAKRFIILLGQFEDLKKVWLKKRQIIALENSKIILDPSDKDILDEHKILSCIKKIERKILEMKNDQVDLMIINKY